ncbi:MAG TPA: ATP-binding protein [Pricia sp.]|nr:ATP-binding protein [Pricia sp.]
MAFLGNLGKKKPGVLPYVLLLVLAVIVLFYIAYTSYRQNQALRESTELVSNTQEVINEINMLFANYMGAESAGVKYLISNDSTYLSPIQGFKDKSTLYSKRLANLFGNNAEQIKRLELVPELSAQLFGDLRSFEPETAEKFLQSQTLRDRISKIEGYLDSLENIKAEMIASEYALLKERRQAYESKVTLTPLNILYSSLFALGVLMFAFSKINSDRKKMGATRSFLRNILSTVQSTISYFEAVRNDEGDIVDFTIRYTNDKILELIGKSAEEIEGNLISEEYPFLMENGDFEVFMEVITTGKAQEVEREYDLPNGHFVFCNEIAKLHDGVTVVAQDITLRKEAEDQLRQTNEELEVQNAILKDSEVVASIGSYTWDIAANTIHYSDNLYRLLGHEPGAFEASYKNFMSFVHPEDLRRLKEGNREIFRQKMRSERTYRINAKGGETKHVQSMDHFIKKKGDTYMVGVVRDITSHLKNERELVAKNRELQRSNSELESFNRVASHDLQEPLRKIQMFISRLYEFEKNRLSEKGTDYLERIESSANRMQYLIRNLLSYSRVADESGKQTKVDLNFLLEKVLDDLSQKIEETGAQITASELPVVYGTEFQLGQLFLNLLSNSLKYKKHDRAPEIVVSSEIVPYHKVDPALNLPRSRYLRLTFVDNGIGFDQNQSHKIFKLFERLHATSAFSGTGLGLAICEKIVENHRGHIAAFGKHNEGARIIIHLPHRTPPNP